MFYSNQISYYIISLGCAKNLVDSEKINGHMTSAGFHAVESYEDAQIIIINTCGFIKSAKEESIDTIFEAVEHVRNENLNSKTDFKKVLIAVGCLTQRYFDDIKNEIPEIDLIYGIADDDFVSNISEKFNIKTVIDKEISRKPLLDGLAYSYIKISEGCSNNCTFCAIPLIRGPRQSLSFESILNEVNQVVHDGAKEIILVAQDTTGFHYDGKDLGDLVSEISKIDKVEWIRILYFYPDNVTDRIINIIRDNPKVVKYVDLPFQHVSENILSKMGRKGNYNKYIKLIEKLRKNIEGIRIRSTFMVGFPGESEEDYNLLLKFVKEAKLDRVGVFKYSPEDNTAAYSFQNIIDEQVKEERYGELMELQKDISQEKLKDFLNTKVRVLVEEKVDEISYIGRTEFDTPEVDGIFYLTGENIKINTIVNAHVTDTLEYDLIGEIL